MLDCGVPKKQIAKAEETRRQKVNAAGIGDAWGNAAKAGCWAPLRNARPLRARVFSFIFEPLMTASSTSPVSRLHLSPQRITGLGRRKPQH